MPRSPRLDAPGGPAPRDGAGARPPRIFRDDRDRADLLKRLAALAGAGLVTVYAWTLLPTHVHLLVRTGRRPLAGAMRSLLTGYAGAFNRRHHRGGHVFQNRYKSILVEEEPYFLELVRYLHLNPLRAGLVQHLRRLDRYPWSGHAALVGRRAVAWQDTATVLRRFAPGRRRAQARYRAFVAEGIPQGHRPELQGGGLVRGAGGWTAVRALRRGRERWVADERILGGSAFVEHLRHAVERAGAEAERGSRRVVTLDELVERVCAAGHVQPAVLRGGGRLPAVSRAREGIAYLWLEALGRIAPSLTAVLGVRLASIYRAAYRGRVRAAQWRRLLGE